MLSSQTVSYAAALVFDALSPGGCFLSMCVLPTALTAHTVLQCLPLDPLCFGPSRIDVSLNTCMPHACAGCKLPADVPCYVL